MHSLAALSYFISVVLAASRTSPPAGALVVSKSPSSGQYGSVQSAVNALSTTTSSAQSIFINPGSYKEAVLIPALKGALTVYGYTTDTTGYASNQVTITNDISAAEAGSDDASGTVRNKAANTKFYNLNIANTYAIAHL